MTRDTETTFSQLITCLDSGKVREAGGLEGHEKGINVSFPSKER